MLREKLKLKLQLQDEETPQKRSSTITAPVPSLCVDKLLRFC